MPNIKSASKLFKVGNSYGLRLTKNDKRRLHAMNGEEFEKNIFPDGQSITFRKRQKLDPKTQAMINKIFHEDHNIIKALKDL